jgi:hypothetical protein
VGRTGRDTKVSPSISETALYCHSELLAVVPFSGVERFVAVENLEGTFHETNGSRAFNRACSG